MPGEVRYSPEQDALEDAKAKARVDAMFAPRGDPANINSIAAQEERITDPRTGGQKGRKEDRYDLLPFDVLEQDALLYGIGSKKYEDRNWEKGYAWSLSLRAIMSHLVAFVKGESYDKEGFHHMAAVRFHAAALMRFEREFPELDDVRGERSDEDGIKPEPIAPAPPPFRPLLEGSLEERLKKAEEDQKRGGQGAFAVSPEEYAWLVQRGLIEPKQTPKGRFDF